MKYLLLIFLLPHIALSQVLNGDFTQIDTCPTDLQGLYDPFPFTHWEHYETADAFHSCAGWPVNPQSNQFGSAPGESFAGFWANNAYYMSGQYVYGYSGEGIAQATKIYQGNYQIGIKLFKAQFGGPTSPPSGARLIFGADTIYTAIADSSAWLYWDTVAFLGGCDTMKIEGGKRAVNSNHFQACYLYVDSITMSPVVGVPEPMDEPILYWNVKTKAIEAIGANGKYKRCK